MKKFLLAFTLLSFAFISCSKNESENATLQLSKNGVIDVPKTATQETITITSNKKWRALVNDTWITLTQAGKNLTIDIAENTLPSSRHATILIVAGDKIEKISINQDAANINIQPDPNNLSINCWEGRYKVDIKSNTEDWTAEVENADWINLTAKQNRNELVLEVKENTDIDKRSAKIIIKATSGTNTEFIVSQEGLPYYILPCIDVDSSPVDIDQIEKERHSELIIDGSYVQNPNNPVYNTKSKAFPQIIYATYNGQISQIVLTAKSKEYINDDFKKLLIEAGFQPVKSDVYTMTMISDAGRIFTVNALISEANSAVYFQYIPKQDKKMDTFDELPLGYIDFEKASVENIKAWEAKNGGKFNDDSYYSDPKDGSYWFDYNPSTNKYSLIMRLYVLNKEGKIDEASECFKDISKFYYEYNGQYYMTEEFSEMLQKTGYEFYAVDYSGYFWYHNATKKVYVGIKVTAFGDINDNKDVVDVHFCGQIPDYLLENMSLSSSVSEENIFNCFNTKIQKKTAVRTPYYYLTHRR